MPKYKVNLNKIYRFPDELRVVEHGTSILVIAPQSANWIVLKSSAHYDVFAFLREGHSIQEVLETGHFSMADVNYVVTQIEARKLCDKKIHSSTDDERSMHLYLTNKCNLFCPHCYMFSGKANEKELTTEEIFSLISDYREVAKGTSITLSGGEPTCHPDFDSIVKYAAKLGLDVKLLTNGTMMTPDRISELAEYIYSVQVSIDGFSEESNSVVRGKGSFDRAMITVDQFVNLGVDTAIAITPPYTVLKNHVDDYVAFAQDMSEKYKDKPFRIKFSDELMQGRCISPSKSFNRTYYELMKEVQHRLYGPEFEVLSFVDALYNNVVLDNCMFGNFAVASNGDVFYCARIGDLLPMANVRSSSLQEIYEKALVAEKATCISNLRPCSECELRFICGGGCRIEEFPELVKRASFDHLDWDSIPPRTCDQQFKSKFYDLMLQSNEYFYSPLES